METLRRCPNANVAICSDGKPRKAACLVKDVKSPSTTRVTRTGRDQIINVTTRIRVANSKYGPGRRGRAERQERGGGGRTDSDVTREQAVGGIACGSNGQILGGKVGYVGRSKALHAAYDDIGKSDATKLINLVGQGDIVGDASRGVLTFTDGPGVGINQLTKRVAGLLDSCLELRLRHEAIGRRAEHDAGREWRGYCGNGF